MNSQTNRSIVLAILALLSCGGCQVLAPSDVDVVKDGVLKGYKSTTVGKAFDGTFQSATWKSFETPKGATIVEFNGTITLELLNKASLSGNQAAESLRTGCIESLGLNAIMERKSQAAQKVEQQYTAIVQSIEERRQPAQRSGLIAEVEDLNTERASTMLAHDKQLKTQKELADQDEAKIQPCIKTAPIPVRFQFLLSADKKTFDINYVDQVFGFDEGKALEFIYR